MATAASSPRPAAERTATTSMTAPSQVAADAVVIGHGLAGLVATCELVRAGRRVALVDAESWTNVGGQAWWSFGGLFLVDSPEQRRLGVKDSEELAWSDWVGTAGWSDGANDRRGKEWARAYVRWASGEKRAWLRSKGVSFLPVVGWAERGDGTATGHGNTVPRFHITWGTGPGLVEPFAAEVHGAVERGQVLYLGRHRVTAIDVEGGRVAGVRGDVLVDDERERGEATSREVVGTFDVRAPQVLVATGGIGGNHELVRQLWPERLGTPPASMVTGVPAYVDGSGIEVALAAGAHIVNRDRMWHYVEGLQNHSPVWPGHGIRILPGPSSLWLDAEGRRLPPPLFPGTDTLGTLEHLRATGHDHSWFITNERIISKEFALSGSEQNPDLTGKDWRGVVGRAGGGVPAPVQAFVDAGLDMVTADDLDTLVVRMNELTPDTPVDVERVRRNVEARDRQVDNGFGKDAQLSLLRQARAYLGDRIMRSVAPHRLTDPQAGPLIAVRLHVLTRKTLGGLETDLDGRVLRGDGQPLPGLYAAGEASGFGGGGLHGHRSLEGTFVGGCLFTGLRAGGGMVADSSRV